jgi:hypothetical protein
MENSSGDTYKSKNIERNTRLTEFLMLLLVILLFLILMKQV